MNVHTREGHPGIWVGEKKIASIGLRIKNGVSLHGISLNICNDLSVYDYFDPCGMAGKVMTNLEQVWGRGIEKQEFEHLSNALAKRLCHM
ncbi:MAG: lipoate-protein ligase B [uncultured bacterium]|nr:MAG: lipoate-protein ligase B [uncultured bacterium]